MKLVYFVFFLWIARLLDVAAGGPESRIVAVVFHLALAYLAIAVGSRIVRNRLLSRLITVVAWGMAALSILDLLDPLMAVLDRTAITVGAPPAAARSAASERVRHISGRRQCGSRPRDLPSTRYA